MTEKDLANEWAWSQIEGYADGSLDTAAHARMRAELGRDARLHRAVERAAAVHAALRGMRREPLPRGLRGRLLRIPGAPTMRLGWAAAAAAAIAAVAIAPLVLRQPEPTPQEIAVRDFQLAMKYVQKSAAITSQEVTGTVGDGVLDALIAGRDSLRNTELRRETGG